MTVKEAMNNVIQAMDGLQVTESHCVNKRTELTDFEFCELDKATREYRTALIDAIGILTEELKNVI